MEKGSTYTLGIENGFKISSMTTILTNILTDSYEKQKY